MAEKSLEELLSEGYVCEYLPCPECGASSGDAQFDYEYEEVWPVEEMWPGGPLVECKGLYPAKRILKSVTITLWCGHIWPSGREYYVRLVKPQEGE
jgi:hypothetical protein